MAIDAVLPTLSTAIQPKSVGFAGDQPKLSAGTNEKTQTENAVAPAGESEGASENGLSSENKEGRGQLVDIKV